MTPDTDPRNPVNRHPWQITRGRTTRNHDLVAMFLDVAEERLTHAHPLAPRHAAPVIAWLRAMLEE